MAYSRTGFIHKIKKLEPLTASILLMRRGQMSKRILVILYEREREKREYIPLFIKLLFPLNVDTVLASVGKYADVTIVLNFVRQSLNKRFMS